MQPKHLAIIMDGNGRWAKGQGHHRFFGHVKGAKVAKSMIEFCAQKNIQYLTLFAFSTENWFRPKEEVGVLMKILFHRLNREKNNLIKNNIRFRCIGDIERLPSPVKQTVLQVIEETSSCSGMTLVFALSYGGRQEITQAVRQMAARVKQGLLKLEDINEETVSSYLQSSFLPDPDLIIRTSGESRISNFFLWQSAYSEFIILKKMWPELTTQDLEDALLAYSTKQRRYGRTDEQNNLFSSLPDSSPSFPSVFHLTGEN